MVFDPWFFGLGSFSVAHIRLKATIFPLIIVAYLFIILQNDSIIWTTILSFKKLDLQVVHTSFNLCFTELA